MTIAGRRGDRPHPFLVTGERARAFGRFWPTQCECHAAPDDLETARRLKTPERRLTAPDGA